MRSISIVFVFGLMLASQSLFNVCAQTPKPYFNLDANETGNSKVYRASQHVTLRKNFRFQATGNNSFRAYIDTSLVFHIKSIENPSPDSIPNPDYDPPYVPGNTYGSDNSPFPENHVDTSLQRRIASLVCPVL